MEKSKGSKASNIYQVLKGAGAWQSKDSKGPMIKSVGIKSPLNLMSDKATLDKYKDKLQSKKNEKARSEGKAVSYKDAYADADKKKYKTYEEFEKAAKSYNKKKYDTENPTSEAKKQNISKEKLAENVKNKKNPPANDDPKPSNTEDTKTVKSTEVTVKSRKQNRADKRITRLSEKAKKKGSLTKGQRRRLAVAEEKSAGKSGKDARLAANEKLNKKDDSALAMKKGSAMKMGKKSAMKMGKKSAMKMGKKSPMKLMPTKAPKAGKKAPTKFNAKLKKAAAEGKIKGKFKEVVENAPIKLKDKNYKPGKKVKTGGSVSSKRAEKLIAKGKGRKVYKIGGIGKDNQPGGKNNKGQLMKIKKRSVKIKNIK